MTTTCSRFGDFSYLLDMILIELCNKSIHEQYKRCDWCGLLRSRVITDSSSIALQSQKSRQCSCIEMSFIPLGSAARHWTLWYRVASSSSLVGTCIARSYITEHWEGHMWRFYRFDKSYFRVGGFAQITPISGVHNDLWYVKSFPFVGWNLAIWQLERYIVLSEFPEGISQDKTF